MAGGKKTAFTLIGLRCASGKLCDKLFTQSLTTLLNFSDMPPKSKTSSTSEDVSNTEIKELIIGNHQ